jgi:hypothetical protein
MLRETRNKRVPNTKARTSVYIRFNSLSVLLRGRIRNLVLQRRSCEVEDGMESREAIRLDDDRAVECPATISLSARRCPSIFALFYKCPCISLIHPTFLSMTDNLNVL